MVSLTSSTSVDNGGIRCDWRDDDEPLNDYAGKAKLGSQLAVRCAQIREHKKASEFTKQ
jgi:hypothetical protein